MTTHLDKLKYLQRRFNLHYDEMDNDQKKEFTNLILTGAIRREEANVMAEGLLRDINNKLKESEE